mgnify:CR=1 FL=1
MSTGQNLQQSSFKTVSKRKNRSPNQKLRKGKAKKQKTLNSYWLSAPKSSNQFELLSSDDTDDENDEQTTQINEESSTGIFPKPVPLFQSRHQFTLKVLKIFLPSLML